MCRGENIVLEGTFSWPGLGPRLLTDLASAEYNKFAFLDVEAPAETAHAWALTRWRRGRLDAINGGDELGWRFTPSFVIDALYALGAEQTICARNARAAFDHPPAEYVATVELLAEQLGGDGETLVKEDRTVVYSRGPTGTSAPWHPYDIIWPCLSTTIDAPPFTAPEGGDAVELGCTWTHRRHTQVLELPIETDQGCERVLGSLKIKDATVHIHQGGHFDPYVEPMFPIIVDEQLSFLRRVVPVSVRRDDS